jgi:hypothetical protein
MIVNKDQTKDKLASLTPRREPQGDDRPRKQRRPLRLSAWSISRGEKIEDHLVKAEHGDGNEDAPAYLEREPRRQKKTEKLENSSALFKASGQ